MPPYIFTNSIDGSFSIPVEGIREESYIRAGDTRLWLQGLGSDQLSWRVVAAENSGRCTMHNYHADRTAFHPLYEGKQRRSSRPAGLAMAGSRPRWNISLVMCCSGRKASSNVLRSSFSRRMHAPYYLRDSICGSHLARDSQDSEKF